MAAINLATEIQKQNFKTKFAEIVKNNINLHNNYNIQFFNTLTNSNYVIKGLDGKSINVITHLSLEELERYQALKHHWKS